MIRKYKTELIQTMITQVLQTGQTATMWCRKREVRVEVSRIVMAFRPGYYYIRVHINNPYTDRHDTKLYDYYDQRQNGELIKLLDKYVWKSKVESKIAVLDGLQFANNN
jgi:hypothetical protein